MTATKRQREKPGHTTLLIHDAPAQMPDAVATQWIKMEMALGKIAALDVEAGPRTAARVAKMLAEDALAGRPA